MPDNSQNAEDAVCWHITYNTAVHLAVVRPNAGQRCFNDALRKGAWLQWDTDCFVMAEVYHQYVYKFDRRFFLAVAQTKVQLEGEGEDMKMMYYHPKWFEDGEEPKHCGEDMLYASPTKGRQPTEKHRGRGVSIEDLPWSIRAYNCLRDMEVRTLGDLASKTEADLLKVDRLGRLTLREIQRQLAAHGIYLVGSPQPELP